MIIEKLNFEIEQHKKVIDQKQAQIQAIHDRVAEAERKCEESLREHQRRTKEVEDQYKEKEKQLQESLRKQMQRVVEEQSRDIEEMQAEFMQGSQLMEQKYSALSAQFSQLQDLFERRPSRPEDLDMIKDQGDQIVQKDAFIKKQEEDMKFYKLELINREQSYNQMFGTAPSIGGVGQVVQSK